MDNSCKEIEKQIPAFLADELTNPQLKRFLAHIDTCEDCREELTIQLLTQVGTKRLEDGLGFHLGKALEECLSTARKRLNHRLRLERLAMVLQTVVFASLLFLAALIVFLF